MTPATTTSTKSSYGHPRRPGYRPDRGGPHSAPQYVGTIRRSATLLPTTRPHRRSRVALAAAALAGSAGLVGGATSVAEAAFAAPTPALVTQVAAPAAPAVVPLDFARNVAALRVPGTAPEAAPPTTPPSPAAPAATVAPSVAPAVAAPAATPVTTATTATVGPSFSGLASWYGGRREEGRRTASGAQFRSGAFTAASRTLPMGTRLRVCRAKACVTVVINDRGPYVGGRILDLSRAAASQVGMLSSGVAYVTATRVR